MMARRQILGPQTCLGEGILITYSPMQPGQEAAVCELILRVFDQFVAPGCTAEGEAEFRRYVEPEALAERAQAGHLVLVAVAGDEIVGAIEMRGCEHLSLLFVDPRYHGRGIGRALWTQALERCRQLKPDLQRISVNSSTYAVPFYRALGFRPDGPEQVRDGIRFVPMTLWRMI
jgi:GNAT superfamily N-acetyltransferase